ncbi:MAG: hypothetical protein QOD49_1949, partial [Actinomycetota bacterium]|nr:hypothetical protein [Actinomycetota bacterium]
VIEDITDRKRSEEALREQADRLRLALDSGRMGTWEWDIRTGRIAWSDNLEEIHGLPRGGFDGTLEGFQRLIHPEDRGLTGRGLLGLVSMVVLEISRFRLGVPTTVPVSNEALVTHDPGLEQRPTPRALGGTR